MASVPGGHHLVGAGHGAAAGTQALGAFSLSLITNPQSPSGGSDTLTAGSHTLVAGGSGTVGGMPPVGPDTVVGHAGPSVPFAGELKPGSDQVVATISHHGTDVTMHLSDGSEVTVLGTKHIDQTLFFHH
jgi:hypothetical protein